MSQLTGRIKYRIGFFGRIVLQVQESRLGHSREHNCTVESLSWRDAHMDDVDELSAMGCSPFPYKPPAAPRGSR